MLNEDSLISTLEQSLRQFQIAEQRLQERLRKIEDEATDLKVEIEALQNSAEKTEEALESLFSTMRSGAKSWKTHRKAAPENETEQPKKSRYDDELDYPKKPRYQDDDDYEMPVAPRRYSRQNEGNQPPPDNYRKNPVSYMNNQKNVAPINRNFEMKSNRFTDRTITQACTLLLREAPKPLHVGELFHLLVEGGFNFTGNNPTISIAVSLNRNRRFRKVAPGTFDLVMRDASQAAS
ncbi:MAG: winged helix-turn-helix domain-containing protein [Pyrinomonadaceae bacterium]|nr:winged helix-turn-helix domain-containing protein [Pyrinomonadaceae bacterium]